MENDYFSFMSAKSGSKALPPDPRVAVQLAETDARPAARDPRHESHMEVIESSLSDSVIEEMFRRPNEPDQLG